MSAEALASNVTVPINETRGLLAAGGWLAAVKDAAWDEEWRMLRECWDMGMNMRVREPFLWQLEDEDTLVQSFEVTKYELGHYVPGVVLL